MAGSPTGHDRSVDLILLVVVLGSALTYVAAKLVASRRPPVPPDPAELLRARSRALPEPSRHTLDRMGVIRTSGGRRLVPRSPALIVALVAVAAIVVVVVVNLPLL